MSVRGRTARAIMYEKAATLEIFPNNHSRTMLGRRSWCQLHNVFAAALPPLLPAFSRYDDTETTNNTGLQASTSTNNEDLKDLLHTWDTVILSSMLAAARCAHWHRHKCEKTAEVGTLCEECSKGRCGFAELDHHLPPVFSEF